MCEAILFDLDGVLVDSSLVVQRHWFHWANNNHISNEKIEPLIHGRRTVDVIRLVAPHLDADIEAIRLENEEGQDINGLKAVKGAKEFLQSLPKNKWAIVTSSSYETAKIRLDATKLPQPSIMITSDDVNNGKPDPQGYLIAANHLGSMPKNCVAIEDTPAGIQAALNAGMSVVALCTTSAKTELCQADMIVKDLTEIKVFCDTYSKNRKSLRILNINSEFF